MQIQRLTEANVERFRTLRLRALRDAPAAFGTTFEDAATWPIEVWSKLLSGITAFVAVVDGLDVGLVRGGEDETSAQTARLGSLWVAPDARGTGVSESLVDEVIGWARAGEFVAVLLDVSDDNLAAIKLYDRMGFERTGVVGALPPPREHLGRHQRRLTLG